LETLKTDSPDVLDAADDPEIQVLAKEFVEEESEHVAKLKRWIQLHLSGAKLPTQGLSAA
jgi:rubrerythrin